MLTNGRCRLHGGKSLRGAAHPNFKHGRYSVAMEEVGERIEGFHLAYDRRLRLLVIELGKILAEEADEAFAVRVLVALDDRGLGGRLKLRERFQQDAISGA